MGELALLPPDLAYHLVEGVIRHLDDLADRRELRQGSAHVAKGLKEVDHGRAALIDGRLAEKLLKPEGVGLLPAEERKAQFEPSRLALVVGSDVFLTQSPPRE